MGRIGISIYPEQSTFKENQEYLQLAAKYGYQRIFMSLLEISDGKDSVVKEFSEIVSYANSLGFEVMLDVNPALFDQLGISYDDLSLKI